MHTAVARGDAAQMSCLRVPVILQRVISRLEAHALDELICLVGFQLHVLAFGHSICGPHTGASLADSSLVAINGMQPLEIRLYLSQTREILETCFLCFFLC